MKYAERMSLELGLGENPTIGEILKDHRRVQDNKTLQMQITGEDAKAGCLTCVQLIV